MGTCFTDERGMDCKKFPKRRCDRMGAIPAEFQE